MQRMYNILKIKNLLKEVIIMAITNNELLRKLVPGVKAEYEVKKFTFPNLVAFVVAKMVNENNQINCMLLDYEKIFEE